MSLLGNIQKAIAERHSAQSEVESTYAAFTDDDGNTYVQVNTYAVGATAANGHPKQVVRFGAKAAEQLVKILKAEFAPASASW